uniref:Uncharacterized protein n=1 Tax=Globodera rostochiensis TaxID=31243 RepID=A0A914H7F8_GLORO
MRYYCIVIFLFFHYSFACFSSCNRKQQNVRFDNEDWVPNMGKLPIGTKKIASEIMMLLDSNLLPSKLCQKMKDLYDEINELDRKLLHIVWWDEIDCKSINDSVVNPFYPFNSDQNKILT